MPPYEVERVAIELISAIACFILLRYMIKPFRVTGESRYLGLPLGFGFLGVSYTFSAISYLPFFNFPNWGWMQLFVRGFAFLFLAITYYFSKSKKKSKLLWNLTIGLLALILAILISLIIVSPQISLPDYTLFYIYTRIFSFACLCYISIHALKSHVEQLNPATILVPFGYIFLAIDQYSSVIWRVNVSYLALFGGLTFRLAGLGIFIYLAYRSTRYELKRGTN
jgi:hypothetical protein